MWQLKSTIDLSAIFDEKYESNFEKYLNSLCYQFDQPHCYSKRFTAAWGIGLTYLQLEQFQLEGGEIDDWFEKQNKLWYHSMHCSAGLLRRFRKGWRIGLDNRFICTFDQRKNHFRSDNFEAMRTHLRCVHPHEADRCHAAQPIRCSSTGCEQYSEPYKMLHRQHVCGNIPTAWDTQVNQRHQFMIDQYDCLF